MGLRSDRPNFPNFGTVSYITDAGGEGRVSGASVFDGVAISALT